MRKTGDIIKDLRTRSGMSQAELAARLGYRDRTTIAKIEANTIAPSLGKLEKLASLFGVSLAYLRDTLERNLVSLDYTIVHKGDAVLVKDTLGGQEREFDEAEWEELRLSGNVGVVNALLSGDNKNAPDTIINVGGLPENKRWMVEYVMSLSDEEAKQLRGVVDFVRSQRD